jgi:hypothetical protein
VAANDDDFVERTAQLLRDAALRRRMSEAARAQACGESWDSVFEKAYEGYEVGMAAEAR